MAEKIKIAGELISLEESHIVASTDAVYDKKEGKFQQEINESLKSGISSSDSKLEAIQETVTEHSSTINDHESRITNAETTLEIHSDKLSEIQEKHTEDVDMLQEQIEMVVSNNLETEAEIRENADSILDEKILNIDERLSLAEIHYVGIAVTLEQLESISEDDLTEVSWALVGGLENLELYVYYPGTAPSGITPKTWTATGKVYNFLSQIGIYTGLDYIVESESAYEQRKQELDLEKNKFYFTYEDDE